MPSYYCWTKHGERGVMMEDNEEEEEDDDGYPNFPEYDDTAEGNEDNEVEDKEAPDEPADDDLGRAIADARRECETEKERLVFDKMIEDHNKLLYPTCEDGHKKLGSTLELLQWKAENGVTDSGFGKLLTIIKRKLPRENLDACPVCTALRYKIRRDDPGDVEGERPRKRVPAKRKFIMMPVLIQGPKQPGNDIDVYLKPLVEELLQLWSAGVRVWDEHKQEEFDLRALLFVTINDWPALVKHFAETRMKRPELRADYDRSLGQSSRASKEAKKVAQLGQQDKQSIPHFVVQSYDDPETASMIEREARAQGASVEYEDYYPTAEVVNKYRYGHDLVKPGELARLGTQMRRLHEWYLRACRRSDRYLTVYLRDEHYFRGREEINLEFEELFQLFNQDALDKAVISCYYLMKKLECKRGKLLPLGFIDPDTVHEVTVQQYPKDTEDNMVMFLVKQANKEDIFFSYNFKFHFILLIIDLHKGVVNVMDSKRKEHAEWADMAAILQRA
ncbi:hypothetical protein QYE76_035859 [Lolium multiflorum]|uniref:Uncharacterized protein n=1 Tax=Lolium multiflorum TaxID=4521 RepID=A0AAD8VNW1_LOLMU|nr:hypothetical protein QYE76_035859 [Lolium multiflorum]